MSTQLFSKTTAEIDADPANFLVVVHGGGQVELMMPQSGSKFFLWCFVLVQMWQLSMKLYFSFWFFWASQYISEGGHDIGYGITGMSLSKVRKNASFPHQKL